MIKNIRLFDGDVITLAKALSFSANNLSWAIKSTPEFIQVFVMDEYQPGGIKLPQGGTLNQAIALAEGQSFKGKIEFIRFDRGGTFDRRIFSYQPSATTNAANNPILASGDIIRVKNSVLGTSTEQSAINFTIRWNFTSSLIQLKSRMTQNNWSVKMSGVSDSQPDDEIDLKQVIGSLLRHKTLIAKIAAVALIFRLFTRLCENPSGKVNFRLFLRVKILVLLADWLNWSPNPLLANLGGLMGGEGSQLETEVKILESPSVLNQHTTS